MESETATRNKFRSLWKYYVFQSLLATVAVFILVLILGKERIVLISAIGATTFIVFAMPGTDSARAKNVIGSHLIGLASGSIFCFISLPYFIEWPFAVGIAIFLMVALDFIHPPAASTALAVAINEFSLDAFVTIMLSVVILSQCRHYLRHYLKNLV